MTSGTIKDRVIASVLRGIIAGEITVDSRISEKQLAEKYEVSRAPVREALVQLCAQKILRCEPRSGYKLVSYSEANIRNILEYRVLLECGCLNDNFDRITETQFNRLETICESEFIFLGHSGEAKPEDYWRQTLDFHLTLASFSENEFIYSRLDSALRTTMMAYLQNYPQEWRDAFYEKSSESAQADASGREPSVMHREIVQCICRRNKEKAVEMLRQDILTFHMPDKSVM